MRLYYMTKLSTAVEHILPERRMKLGQFDKLNDPFELMCTHIGDSNHRLVSTALRDSIAKRWGVICMAKHWRSPLMWAHYAENHTGVCLGFDVNSGDHVRQVQYVDERITLPLDMRTPTGGHNLNSVHTVLTTKYSQWAYEEEWRMFGTLEKADPKSGFYYVPFGPSLTLREIVVGTRCGASVGSFRKLLSGLDHSVRIIKARPAFETFTMVRQQRVSAITVHPRKATNSHAQTQELAYSRLTAPYCKLRLK